MSVRAQRCQSHYFSTTPRIYTRVLISSKPDPTDKTLKSRHFSSGVEVIAAAETWLDGQPSEFFFFEWLAKVKVWSYGLFPSWSD